MRLVRCLIQHYIIDHFYNFSVKDLQENALKKGVFNQISEGDAREMKKQPHS